MQPEGAAPLSVVVRWEPDRTAVSGTLVARNEKDDGSTAMAFDQTHHLLTTP